ncbi:unnamed protein product [Trichobilharzia regenti]|nr:unnamed protein product [Trichobilharzia regenti]
MLEQAGFRKGKSSALIKLQLYASSSHRIKHRMAAKRLPQLRRLQRGLWQHRPRIDLQNAVTLRGTSNLHQPHSIACCMKMPCVK